MRSILVTGGAGYIGSHVVLDLLSNGHRPVVLDNFSTGSSTLVPIGVPLVKADISDDAIVRRTLLEYGIRDVIHCAGSLRVDESMRDPLKYWDNNVGKAIALMESCRVSGVQRLAFSSTAAVYGDHAVMPVTETQIPAPLSPYGTTKRAVEIMIADVCRATGMSAVCLRYFNVAGADPQGRAGASPRAEPSLVRAACQTALGIRDNISIFGTDYDSSDGTAVRDYIHVCDLAGLHSILLDSLRGEAEGTVLTINCGYGKGITVKEVVESVARVSGVSFPIQNAPRRLGDIGVMVADTRLLRERYHWVPAHCRLDGIIADTLNWERAIATVNDSVPEGRVKLPATAGEIERN